MKNISDQFDDARQVLNRAPLAKLFRPGLHKFGRRLLARRGWGDGPIQIRLFFGERMTVVLPEVISETLHSYGLFDETVTWIVLQSVRPGNVILDIGAHFGYFSLLFAHLTGPSGRVLAFEPTPSTFGVLSENVGQLSLVEALNCAAGDSPGNIAIADFGLKYSAWNTLAETSRLGEAPAGTAARRIPVQVVRPDQICAERKLQPDFIKIDAENFEDKVISGLAGVFAVSRPQVLMETGSEQSLAAARRLCDYGYRLRVSDGPGSLYDWNGTTEEANARYKDVLFVPGVR